MKKTVLVFMLSFEERNSEANIVCLDHEKQKSRTLDVSHFFLSILISKRLFEQELTFHQVLSCLFTLVMEKLFSCNNFRAVAEEARLLLISYWSMVSFEIDCWRSLKKATENILIRSNLIHLWTKKFEGLYHRFSFDDSVQNRKMQPLSPKAL